MRIKILAIAALGVAIGAPIAAQAQGVTVGVAPGPGVAVTEFEGIAVDQRPAFREYIVRERIPNYTIPDRVIVGGVLPETGVRIATCSERLRRPYRLHGGERRDRAGEPRTRRIVQVIE